jgi:hypothetical protein
MEEMRRKVRGKHEEVKRGAPRGKGGRGNWGKRAFKQGLGW